LGSSHFVRLFFIGEELFTIKTPELRRASIVAAIYATYKVDESEARAFWCETARGGQDYEEKSPSTVLDSDLKAFAETPRGTRVEFAPGKPMQAGNYYGGCINAWNAHRKGKEIDRINWDVSKGTPHPI
jgi:hypothetical protein